MLLLYILCSHACWLVPSFGEHLTSLMKKSVSFLLSNWKILQEHLHDFKILAVRSTGDEVHVMNELGMDELGMGAYALASEFNH